MKQQNILLLACQTPSQLSHLSRPQIGKLHQYNITNTISVWSLSRKSQQYSGRDLWWLAETLKKDLHIEKKLCLCGWKCGRNRSKRETRLSISCPWPALKLAQCYTQSLTTTIQPTMATLTFNSNGKNLENVIPGGILS